MATHYTVTGTPAQELADRFNQLPASQPTLPCTADLGPSVVLIATQADGRLHQVVGNAGGCGLTVSDTAWRAARDLLITLIRSPQRPLQTSPPYASIRPGPS